MGFFSKLTGWLGKKPAAAPEATPSPEVEAAQAVQEPLETTGVAAAEPAEAPAAPAAATPAPAATPAESAPLLVREDWQKELTLALRQAEPKLSVWLSILLHDVTAIGPDLWERLRFLFTCLEAPKAETEDFIARFSKWLEDMGYEEVEEFRSELQYRLALALDLEDEEDERSRLLLKLTEGLAKTREQIAARLDNLLTSHTKMDDEFWDELEEILIMADVGFEPASKLLAQLKSRVRKAGVTESSGFKDILREELAHIFRAPKTIKAINPPEVVMMVGSSAI